LPETDQGDLVSGRHLFDNLSSIYDIGRQSFGDAIRLVEHFRCVPEIIAFSNQLSYEGKIQPLREANSTNLKPACIARRVKGIREKDVNHGEAENIIATIKAMTRHPAYAGKTMGVISLKGNEQAVLIQTMLHKELDTIELENRRIQAGISGEFQGDERDIIFLSMVDSSADEGTLRTTGAGAFEQTKKRYNVAASRARDQLWVVHSFDPDLNLKSSDLRFQLLRHVKDPQATLRAFDKEEHRTESPFEREVLRRLTSAGYLVRTQWQVGYFRIDMVVEGVWVGNASGQPMHDVSGVSGAAPVWRDVMDWLHRGNPAGGRSAQPSRAPQPPAGLVRTSLRFEPPHEPARQEWFIAGTESRLVRSATGSGLASIAYPADGTVIALDPDIPPRRQRMPLKASGTPARGSQWQLDGQPIGPVSEHSQWLLQPGRHRLALLDRKGDEVDSVNFEVRALRAKPKR
jgi:hypothetical protein